MNKVLMMAAAMGGGISYLLRDEFTTARAAGSVNGTAAEPGPGTRTVTDSESKLSISGAKLVLAGGKAAPGFADPACYYPTITRQAGRLMVAQTTIGNNSGIFGLGYNTNPAPGNGPSIGVFDYQTTLQAFSGGNSSGAMGLELALSTSYYCAVVLRSSGGFAFIKGGSFAKWNLYYSSLAGSDATLYPIINGFSDNGSFDFIRIPRNLWLPTPKIYDTFTRGNGSLGNSEIIGPDGQACSALAWADSVGTWAIATNKATCPTLSGGIGIATVDAGVRNTHISAALTVAAGTAGIVASYVDASNYIYAYHNGTNATLVKVVGGTPTTLVDEAAAYGAGRILKLIVFSNLVTMFYNDARIGITQTVGDAGLQAGTRAGIFTSNSGNSIDNFTVFPYGTSSEYSDLDKYIA